MTITEDKFYKMMDVASELEDVTNEYYPTVETLKAHRVEENVEKYLGILIYFAANPFKRLGIREQEDEEYKEMVKYANKLIGEVELT